MGGGVKSLHRGGLKTASPFVRIFAKFGKNGNTQAKQRRDELKPIIEEIYHENNQIYV